MICVHIYTSKFNDAVFEKGGLNAGESKTADWNADKVGENLKTVE